MSDKPTYTKLAIVNIDHVHLLLPVADALKMAEILQRARRLEHDFSNQSRMAWTECGAPHVELQLLRSDDPLQRADVNTPSGKRKAPPNAP